MFKVKSLVVAITAIGLVGCASLDANRDAGIGVLIGAAAGAAIGNNVSHADGAPIVGAVIGGLLGAGVGNYMDRQRAELQQKLAAEAARKELNITQLGPDTIKIGIASDVAFDKGSASIRPEAQATYAKIANILKSYDQTVVHIVGHTDTTGSADFNQGLSQQRAGSVAYYLNGQGLGGERTRQEGRGERELLIRTPDNTDESRNRRVDIVIKAVVKGNEQAAYSPPPYLGG